ncbi:hypothetical protein WICPIJ_002926 [Wickerhamomyces pijperi]|uniref:GATA-type domain-containing protein n=1 Tax=Wickerhamomyces pijperi TaxID=599730 RepID=A0A9P8TPD2_WICPI|nr:hypothetical protein WICPIJ_002926 [Wickerhamomyces pijperi]
MSDQVASVSTTADSGLTTPSDNHILPQEQNTATTSTTTTSEKIPLAADDEADNESTDQDSATATEVSSANSATSSRISTPTPHSRHCANCKVHNSAIWYNHPKPQSPGEKLCNACWQYNRKHPGQMRDINNIRRGRPRAATAAITKTTYVPTGGRRGRPPKQRFDNEGKLITVKTNPTQLRHLGSVGEDGVFRVSKAVIFNMIVDEEGKLKFHKRAGRPKKVYELPMHGLPNDDEVEPLPRMRPRIAKPEPVEPKEEEPPTKRKTKMPGKFKDALLEGEAVKTMKKYKLSVLPSSVTTKPASKSKSSVKAEEKDEQADKKKRGRPTKKDTAKPKSKSKSKKESLSATASQEPPIATFTAYIPSKVAKPIYTTSLHHVQRDAILSILTAHHDELLRNVREAVRGVVDKYVQPDQLLSMGREGEIVRKVKIKDLLSLVKPGDGSAADNDDDETEDEDENKNEEQKKNKIEVVATMPAYKDVPRSFFTHPEIMKFQHENKIVLVHESSYNETFHPLNNLTSNLTQQRPAGFFEAIVKECLSQGENQNNLQATEEAKSTNDSNIQPQQVVATAEETKEIKKEVEEPSKNKMKPLTVEISL